MPDIKDIENSHLFDMNSAWTQQNIANFLGLSPAVTRIQIVADALAVLENSPLLDDQSVFPKLPKRAPRKRDDYKCGNCGMKKRNHSCVSNSEEPGPAPEDNLALQAFKKRKKTFKPLTVLILDSYNHQVQQYLDEIKRFGENEVNIELRIGTGNNGFCLNVFGSWDDKNGIYLGQLSDSYKDYVKLAFSDSTFLGAKLAPLQQGALDAGLSQTVWMPQLYIYRSCSWRTKRLSEAEYLGAKKRDDSKPDMEEEDDYPSPEDQLAHLHMLIEQQHYVQQIQLLQQQYINNSFQLPQLQAQVAQLQGPPTQFQPQFETPLLQGPQPPVQTPQTQQFEILEAPPTEPSFPTEPIDSFIPATDNSM